MTPLLTVGYSCLAERVGDIREPEAHASVEYLVLVQGGVPVVTPEWARVVEVGGIGVAKSRNAAIDAAGGRYLLFCDDDVTLDLAGALAGVQHLDASGHAIALGRSLGPGGRLRKSYPEHGTRLTKFNTAKTGTTEMLIDVAQVRSAGLRFDERFGAGAPLHLADEYIFVVDLLRAGLTGEAIAEVFGAHPHASSGDRWETAHDAHVRAVALNRVFGRAAPFVRVAFALRHRRQLGGPRRLAAFVANGARPPEREASTSSAER